MLRAFAVAILVLLLGFVRAPASAQSSFVGDLLKAVTVRIDVKDKVTGDEGLCQGFVYAVFNLAFIATARHCLDTMVSVAFNDDRSRWLPDLSINIRYPNGAVGESCHAVSARNADVLVLAAAFAIRPVSYVSVCRGNCRFYGVDSFEENSHFSVMSVLSAGGGPLVVSSGVVFVDNYGRYSLALPSSSGTSGAPVFDMAGNLLGIVVGGYVHRAAEAGWITEIVLGENIHNLVGVARDRAKYDDLLSGPCRMLEEQT